jgi:hypothetical protein
MHLASQSGNFLGRSGHRQPAQLFVMVIVLAATFIIHRSLSCRVHSQRLQHILVEGVDPVSRGVVVANILTDEAWQRHQAHDGKKATASSAARRTRKYFVLQTLDPFHPDLLSMNQARKVDHSTIRKMRNGDVQVSVLTIELQCNLTQTTCSQKLRHMLRIVIVESNTVRATIHRIKIYDDSLRTASRTANSPGNEINQGLSKAAWQPADGNLKVD